jgi:hypothetical protein
LQGTIKAVKRILSYVKTFPKGRVIIDTLYPDCSVYPNTYMLKSVGIPEYYLGGSVEFLGEAWKNQGLGLALSAKTYIQNDIQKFEGLFGKEFKPVETPMSERYHPEIDDSPLCIEDDSAKYRSIIGCLLLHLDNCLR